MKNKTTVAIDTDLRRTIKKLAAWLDISQGELIGLAIAQYEKVILNQAINPDQSKKSGKIEIDTILQAATEAIWSEDPETKAIQQKLKKGQISLDKILLNNWDYGLES